MNFDYFFVSFISSQHVHCDRYIAFIHLLILDHFVSSLACIYISGKDISSYQTGRCYHRNHYHYGDEIIRSYLQAILV